MNIPSDVAAPEAVQTDAPATPNPPPEPSPESSDSPPSTKTLTVTTSNGERPPYIPRHHETSLKLFFQDSSYPQWDRVLETNVMGLDIPKAEVVGMMDSVIKEFGSRIFVTKRKGDSLAELNELVQLQFCVMRNLHLGDRARTAQVRLGDLMALQRAAASTTSGMAPSPVVGTQDSAPLAAGSPEYPLVPRPETRTEAAFIKDYDRLQTVTNLMRGQYVPRSPTQKTDRVKPAEWSAQSLGVYKGGNLRSAAKDKATQDNRLIPGSRKLIRT